MTHTSDLLLEQREALSTARDSEIQMAYEVKLSKAWDKMIDLLDKTIEKCQKIEESVSNFYGD